MRELTVMEMDMVAAADGDGGSASAAVDSARNVCQNNGLPDSTKVTISWEVGGSIGIGTTNTSNATTIEVETTCGELAETSGK